MAAVTKASDAHVDTITAAQAGHIAGDLFAGEDLAACDFCYIKGSDGAVWRCAGGAAAGNEATRLAGVTPKAVKSGQVVDLLNIGLQLRYASSGLTPGAILYLGATGGLDTAAQTGDAVGVAQAINDTDIRVTRAI